MKRPNRKPDFIQSIHEFWIYPEMVWGFKVGPHAFVYNTIVDKEGVLMSKDDILWGQAQDKYKEYKKRIDSEIDSILLDAETESK